MAKININDYDNETPYRKKKDKKSPKKANHKHNFVPFIAYGKDKSFGKTHYMIAEECSVCQKRRVQQYFVTVPEKDRPFRRMVTTLEEMKEVFPDYEVKEWDEYIF